jgi:G:T-mismatch repair DNA endonuclease (very short patch repair protein)
MRRVRSRDTTPEMIVRKALTRLGARYRLHRADRQHARPSPGSRPRPTD